VAPEGLAAAIRRALETGGGSGTVLVAVDGPGGAGKTTVALALAQALERHGRRVAIVPMDDFYLPSAQRPAGPPGTGPVGGAFDWRRLRGQVLVPLRAGRAARYERYDWIRDVLAETHDVEPGIVVVVEGVTSCRRELAPLYDLRVWVDCPRELRLTRGLARDGESARARWVEEWMPEEDRYAEEHRPRATADVIVDGSADEGDDAATF